MPSIDDYIDRRNEIQLRAEAKGNAAGAAKWTELGVANRHIARVLEGTLPLTPELEHEIESCLRRADA